MKISNFFKQEIPSFIARDYPKYIIFFKGFFEWMDENKNPADISSNLSEYRNVDVIDDYLEYIKKEHISNMVHIDSLYENNFIKNVKQLYISKGTEQSFKFLSRILFGQEAIVSYPKDFMMKSSDGVYYKKLTILTDINNDVADYLYTTLYGVTSEATATIENILRYNTIHGFVTEISLSNIEGDFLSNELVKLTHPKNGTIITGNIYTGICDTNIIDGGYNYEVGDSFTILSGTHGGSGFECFVKSINKGSIKSIEVINTGIGYSVGDSILFDNTDTLDDISGISAKAYISRVGGSGEIEAIKILEPGYGYYKIPSITIDSTGTGADLSINPDDIGSIQSLFISKAGMNYHNDPSLIISPLIVNGSDADITPLIGAIRYYDGVYKENKSFVSDAFKIQDSYFYQDYSYLVQSATALDEKSSHNIQNYREVFVRLLHPIGLKFFSELLLEYYIECVDGFDVWIEIGFGEGAGDGDTVLEYTIEFISYIERLLDETIFQYKDVTIDSLSTDTIGSFLYHGGSHVDIELELQKDHNLDTSIKEVEIEVGQT